MVVGIARTAKEGKWTEPICPSTYDPRSDKGFSVKSSLHLTARKGNYKALGNGQFVKIGWRSWLRNKIGPASADARYHRAAYESSQRTTAMLIAETHRAAKGEPSEYSKVTGLADNQRIKSRFYSQDNLRFNPEFAREENGLSPRDRMAVRLALAGKWANGLTEFGAAPTGATLKAFRLATASHRSEKSMGGQVRMFGALLVALPGVAALNFYLFKKLGRHHMIDQWIRSDSERKLAIVSSVACSFSAIAAVTALFSVGFSGLSRVVGSRSALSPQVMQLVRYNQDKHMHRLYLLLNEAKDKQGAVELISKALKYKVGANYKEAPKEGDMRPTPILVSRLLGAVRGATSEADAKLAMQQVIGSYMTEVDLTGETPGTFMEIKTHKAELLTRENHVVALTNLIEHIAIDEDKHRDYRDVRGHLDGGVKATRKFVLNRSGGILNMLGFEKNGAKLQHMATKEYLNGSAQRNNDPTLACARRFSAENILNNSHQYGPITRNLAFASAGLRIFNSEVVLSLNGQVTRPIAWLAGRITEKVFRAPNSRTTSFSIGRFFSSSFWAVMEGLGAISAAGGEGFAFKDKQGSSKSSSNSESTSNTQSGDEGDGFRHEMRNLKFPFGLPIFTLAFTLPISITSTAAQMLFIIVPSMALMAAAKVACSMEGWKGNVVRSPEPANSRRKTLTLNI